MRQLIIFALTLISLSLILEKLDLIHPLKWYVLAFFGFISYLNHNLMKLGFANDREKFVPFFMACTGIRLLMSATFIGYFIFQKEPQIYLLISNFFIAYLLFTGFEIYELYRKLRDFS